jgi:transposase
MSRPQAQKGAEPAGAGSLPGLVLDKIHLKTDWNGGPLGFCLTGGEASDSPHFETLLDLGPDITPRAAVGDKGYDSKANRQAARSRSICPAIPSRTTTKEKPTFFPKALYRGRARIEQTIGKLKRFKRVALRCDKTDENYGSFVAPALSFILIKSVHRT